MKYSWLKLKNDMMLQEYIARYFGEEVSERYYYGNYTYKYRSRLYVLLDDDTPLMFVALEGSKKLWQVLIHDINEITNYLDELNIFISENNFSVIENKIINYNLYLDKEQNKLKIIDKNMDKLEIYGDVKFYHLKNNVTLPSNTIIHGELTIEHCDIQIPANLVCDRLVVLESSVEIPKTIKTPKLAIDNKYRNITSDICVSDLIRIYLYRDMSINKFNCETLLFFSPPEVHGATVTIPENAEVNIDEIIVTYPNIRLEINPNINGEIKTIHIDGVECTFQEFLDEKYIPDFFGYKLKMTI